MNINCSGSSLLTCCCFVWQTTLHYSLIPDLCYCPVYLLHTYFMQSRGSWTSMNSTFSILQMFGTRDIRQTPQDKASRITSLSTYTYISLIPRPHAENRFFGRGLGMRLLQHVVSGRQSIQSKVVMDGWNEDFRETQSSLSLFLCVVRLVKSLSTWPLFEEKSPNYSIATVQFIYCIQYLDTFIY